ncbi:hypothetical protein EI94DRAFT_800457 [Lactarius quietus]|nr:hypothetical protein EI94DRAFT_800457 [Lactarius quietus]
MMPQFQRPTEYDDEDIAASDKETDFYLPWTTIDWSAPRRVFTSPAFRPSCVSIGSTAASALVLVLSESSTQPASVTHYEGNYGVGEIQFFGCFVVASKDFTIETGGNQRPLCEADGMRRLGDLCEKCGLAVREITYLKIM